MFLPCFAAIRMEKARGKGGFSLCPRHCRLSGVNTIPYVMPNGVQRDMLLCSGEDLPRLTPELAASPGRIVQPYLSVQISLGCFELKEARSLPTHLSLGELTRHPETHLGLSFSPQPPARSVAPLRPVPRCEQTAGAQGAPPQPCLFVFLQRKSELNRQLSSFFIPPLLPVSGAESDGAQLVYMISAPNCSHSHQLGTCSPDLGGSAHPHPEPNPQLICTRTPVIVMLLPREQERSHEGSISAVTPLRAESLGVTACHLDLCWTKQAQREHALHTEEYQQAAQCHTRLAFTSHLGGPRRLPETYRPAASLRLSSWLAHSSGTPRSGHQGLH